LKFLIFPAILIAEYAFFTTIGSKVQPMLPSDVLTMIQEVLQKRSPRVTVSDLSTF
jgi:hypothetical protein